LMSKVKSMFFEMELEKMILTEVAYNIWPVLLAQLVGIIIFFVIAYYFAKFLVIKLTPLVLKIKREEEDKRDRGQDD
jgi:uncharacterized membrane protein